MSLDSFNYYIAIDQYCLAASINLFSPKALSDNDFSKFAVKSCRLIFLNALMASSYLSFFNK